MHPGVYCAAVVVCACQAVDVLPRGHADAEHMRVAKPGCIRCHIL